MEAASAMSMDRLFGKIKQLPTIPKLLHELMQSFNDENARIDEIAAKIAMDQVISVKVLRMANSAALRRGNEITSIEQAVIRRDAAARPAMEEDRGLAAARAHTFVVDRVAVSDVEHAGEIRFDRRIEGAQGSHDRPVRKGVICRDEAIKSD